MEPTTAVVEAPSTTTAPEATKAPAAPKKPRAPRKAPAAPKGVTVDPKVDNTKPAPDGEQATTVKAPRKPRTARPLTQKQKEAAEKKVADAAAEAAAEAAKPQVEKDAEKTMRTMTHRENCFMVTAGGNRVGWTAKGGQLFSFSFFDDGVAVGSGSWGGVLVDEMASYGIAAKKGGSAVLNSLEKKGLIEKGAAHEDGNDHWWSLTELGVQVANALNDKVWN
jgi:hypothetical protein